MQSVARNRFAVLMASIICFTIVACSSDTGTTPTSSTSSGPTGGWLTLQLVTPRTDDGAVQFAVTGPAIDSVVVINYDGFGSVTGAEADVVITGSVTGGDMARIYIPDLSRTLDYSATVTAAASRDTYSLQALTGYRAVLVR